MKSVRYDAQISYNSKKMCDNLFHKGYGSCTGNNYIKR